MTGVAATLGNRLHTLRIERGWTLAELATRSSVSVSYLNDIEHDRTIPSLGRLQSIAEALELDARSVLAGVEPFDSGSN